MPWKKSDGTYLKEGQAWVGVDGTKYPSVWTRFSDSELKSFGLTWEDPPASEKPVDTRFYSGRKTDGTLIEKSLDDTPAVDSDGKEIIDPRTDKQLVYTGLKSHWIAQTKETANIMLAKTDWMITRKYEKGTAIPSDTTSYRDSIRTACNTIETKINNCTKLSELIALFDTPLDSEGVATGQPPIFDFPEES
tara:strand:+ start:1190 stop:1765 length:576 start_codon:yes stop_codon:yes gene_type:complete